MNSSERDRWCRDLAGHTVGEYELIEFVGAGQIGYVYQALHKAHPGPMRAVKLVFDILKPGWENEIRKVMLLDLVDNVVHFHASDTERLTHDGESHLTQYTVWDFIPPGEDLRAYLTRLGSVPTSVLVAVAERVLHVLHACELHGVPHHGDLHAGNILIGDDSLAKLNPDTLEPHAPIYVSDFGYGTTGGAKEPKDDYEGLADIMNEIIVYIDRTKSTATDKKLLAAITHVFPKLLHEPPGAERRRPLDLLRTLQDIRNEVQMRPRAGEGVVAGSDRVGDSVHDVGAVNVGYFQVTEMIGERWDWYKRLFVSAVPARSKILALDIPTVVTGPRGCGKTMLFRRLSERLVVECGEVEDLPVAKEFVGFYVNANDFADAFSRFPAGPTKEDEAHLTCYANLCILAELLAVESSRESGANNGAGANLLRRVRAWLVSDTDRPLVEGESELERYRTVLEQLKWRFLGDTAPDLFPGYRELSAHRWLPRFMKELRDLCRWIGGRSILLFIDDYSTPRVSAPMQRVLNRLLLQRSPYFLAKVATEAATTFVGEDSSGKNLEDGDDYQLADMGEESLFLEEPERMRFLRSVFSRRLELDKRVPSGSTSLVSLLGRNGLSKTEFARRLRSTVSAPRTGGEVAVSGGSQRRGRSRPRVLYSGEDVFVGLWSGDTRTMIQLISGVVDRAWETGARAPEDGKVLLPVDGELQDRVFRTRGGEWLSAHSRNEPTRPSVVKDELERITGGNPDYKLCGPYGDHLKAVVEAFVAAARNLLLGATYRMRAGGKERQVPRMAFRIEIVDEFRIDGLAREIYRDLVRYGLFIRDSRGKSVRGTFVPRLFLRRLLLPYATLALSKRDSVPLKCSDFRTLLLEPDDFKARIAPRFRGDMSLPLFGDSEDHAVDPSYDDLADEAEEATPEEGDTDESHGESDGAAGEEED